jgi:hypothetical protein
VYSQRIIEANMAKVEEYERRRRAALRHTDIRYTTNFRLQRFPQQVIEDMVAHLESIVDPETGQFRRDLTKTEQRFIDNELIVCQLDWRHWNENYCYIKPAVRTDGPEGWAELKDDFRSESAGPLVKFRLNGMQEGLLRKLAELEEIAHDQAARGVPVNGILLILLKARQLGASTMWQALMRHRVNFYSHQQGIVASMDDQSTQALQRRSDIMHERMPVWMQAAIARQTIDRGIVFKNGSVIELQDSKQKKDLGKGETWHLGHVTECSTFDRPEDHFEEGLFPAIDFSKWVLFGMESTAKGKLGWWYEFCMQVMSGTGDGGAGRFSYNFAPFYLIDIAEDSKSKYRLEPPVGWEPAPPTLLMAQKVFDTSPQYTPDKNHVRLPREVLHWWERTRSMYHRRGKLNIFYQSYPSTADEAFQHSAAGAFDNDTIERLDLNCSRYDPIPYRLAASDELPNVENDPARPTHHVAGYHLVPMHESELDRDPRGIMWFWEQPSHHHDYVCASDPTGGIPGWKREFRQSDDVKTDNATIGVFRKSLRATTCEACSGMGWKPTSIKGITSECYDCDGRGKIGGRPVQAVEFAAPIDAEEDLPTYIYVLSSLFVGKSGNEQCLTILEGNNTGLLSIRKLQSKFQHSNLYQHRSLEGMTPKYLNGFGFYSSPTSVPILHARGRSMIVRRHIEIRSRWLVKELSDAVVKITGENGEGGSGSIIVRERFYVPPGAGRHDDRMTMLFLALWALFDWTESPESDTAAEANVSNLPPLRDFANTDATANEQMEAWNRYVEVMAGEQDLHFGHYPDCSVDCKARHDDEEENEFWAKYEDEGDYGGNAGAGWPDYDF